MTLEARVEVVVADIHDCKYGDVYQTLARVLANNDGKKFSPAKKRVFLTGDVRDVFDVNEILNSLPKKELEEFISLKESNDRILAEKYQSNPRVFKAALQAGSVPENELKIIAGYETVLKKLVLGRCSKDYEIHKQEVLKLQSLYPTLDWHAVEGNHDSGIIKECIGSVDWLRYSQSLLNEGVVGAFGCHPSNGDIPPDWTAFAPPLDDHLTDLNKSHLYQNFKDVNINLIVAHSGADIGPVRKVKGRKFKALAGITKLAKDNGAVVYEGHLHEGIIYWSKDTGNWVIRPGVHHVAEVWRKGKDINRIRLYRIPGKLDDLEYGLAA